jgi:hypothetical protein
MKSNRLRFVDVFILLQMNRFFSAILLTFIVSKSFGQVPKDDSAHLDYRTIYSLCLDGNVKPALNYISKTKSKKLTLKDQLFVSAFEKRFGSAQDRGEYAVENSSAISDILLLYRNYWRISLLDSSVNQDSVLISQLVSFLSKKYSSSKDSLLNTDTLDLYLRKYIASQHFNTTGFGKTGKLFDLLVWKKQEDTIYTFTTGYDKVNAHVIFMVDFITLGWEQYATLGKYYPGGWANDTALYCVKKAYDLQSESFLISYLAHEGRHLADYKLFPKLTSADLEYRGKMTELSLADSTLYELIEFFIANANHNSENGHSVADYYAIRDLSQAIFHKEFEKDLNIWKKTPVKEIHEAANQLLTSNTKSLLALGSRAGDSIYIKHK